MSMATTHKDLEFHVDRPDGTTAVYKTANEAAGLAIAIAMSRGEPVHIDVVCWSLGAAHVYGGDDAATRYREDPDASVFERIVVRAESLGRIA
jgi:hypothetical protein